MPEPTDQPARPPYARFHLAGANQHGWCPHCRGSQPQLPARDGAAATCLQCLTTIPVGTR